MLWCSFSSVGWDLSDILIDEMIDIGSHVLWVSNILLLSKCICWKVLECWVQYTIDGMLFSCLWGWEYTVIVWCESDNSWVNLLVTDIGFLSKSICWKMLECWVQYTVDGMLYSWIWGWEYTVIVWCESDDSWVNLLVTDIGFLSKRFWFIEPLELWVLETICWIRFLSTSPWLWQNRFIVRGKSMNFFYNTIISDISLFLLSKSFWFIEPLELWVFETIDWISFLSTSPWLW